MSDFDSDDPCSGDHGFSTDSERRDVIEWNGTYRGYTSRYGNQTDAISPEDGYLGRYDSVSDTTVDGSGMPLGKGNWLMALFRRS